MESSIREIYRNAWSALSDRDAVGDALEMLEDTHWIAGRVENERQRPSFLPDQPECAPMSHSTA